MGIYICHMKIIGCLTILDGDFTFPPPGSHQGCHGPAHSKPVWEVETSLAMRETWCPEHVTVVLNLHGEWTQISWCALKKTPADLMIHKYDWKLWIAQALMFSIMVSIRPSILESQWFDSYPWVDQPEKWASRTVNVRVSLKIYTIRTYIFWN